MHSSNVSAVTPEPKRREIFSSPLIAQEVIEEVPTPFEYSPKELLVYEEESIERETAVFMIPPPELKLRNELNSNATKEIADVSHH